MKLTGKRRCIAGIVLVAAITAACTAPPPAHHSGADDSRPGASPPAQDAARYAHSAPELSCTTLDIATAAAAEGSGERSPLDMPPIPGGGLDDVAVRSSSSALAVGNTVPTPPHSRALVVQWDGATWRTISDWTLPTESYLGAVAMFAGGAWAVGTHGMAEHGRIYRPLIVRVTGSTVRRVQIPLHSYDSSFDDVDATSASDAWAVGYNFSMPLILHWNGTAWKRAELPAGIGRGIFLSVAATSRTNAWAVMYPANRARAKIAHWNGRVWGDVVSPVIGTSYSLYGIAATSAENVWAVGTTRSSAVILHWNGRRWTCALSPPNDVSSYSLHAVSASSADDVWAVGTSFSATRPLALHWNGHTWRQVMIPPPGKGLLDGVAVVPDSARAWIVGGTDDGTLMLHWNGSAWD
ncbi:MAG: hypothetical protein LBV34_08340 [Nocardiopsaceae bacterium]|nr:hypothetical protein [Nocardiopsaceae bacterium]